MADAVINIVDLNNVSSFCVFVRFSVMVWMGKCLIKILLHVFVGHILSQIPL